MNGRVQDAAIGRFISADPYIPDPLSSQSFNRYSYVQNNPLTRIDPSGFDDGRGGIDPRLIQILDDALGGTTPEPFPTLGTQLAPFMGQSVEEVDTASVVLEEKGPDKSAVPCESVVCVPAAGADPDRRTGDETLHEPFTYNDYLLAQFIERLAGASGYTWWTKSYVLTACNYACAKVGGYYTYTETSNGEEVLHLLASVPSVGPLARGGVLAAKGVTRGLGRSSTANLSKGTTLARNLREQLAIEQAAAAPRLGTKLPIKMADPRWPETEGWVKMQQIINTGGEGPINVHYVYNELTGAIDDFKIVIPGPR